MLLPLDRLALLDVCTFSGAQCCASVSTPRSSSSVSTRCHPAHRHASSRARSVGSWYKLRAQERLQTAAMAVRTRGGSSAQWDRLYIRVVEHGPAGVIRPSRARGSSATTICDELLSIIADYSLACSLPAACDDVPKWRGGGRRWWRNADAPRSTLVALRV